MKNILKIALIAVMAGGSVMAQAYEKGDWIIRAGATRVVPDTVSDDINLPTGLVAKAEVDDDKSPGIMPTYMLTSSWGVQLLAALPYEHGIEAQGRGAIEGVSLPAGSTKHLPPTVTVQWYPRGSKVGWQPYIGVGVNYTIFFDEDVDSQTIGLLGDLTGGAVTDADLELDESFGLAANIGVDIPINKNWSINLAIWYIDIETEATITAKGNGIPDSKVNFDVELDPWVYNIGIAYKF